MRCDLKTKLSYEKGRISLVVDHGKDTAKEKMVLAAMTLFEGTGCWSLIDIRLEDNPVAHPWSGSGAGEDFYATFKPKTPDEAAYIRSQLKEYEERDDGSFRWCTFKGIVRGHYEIKDFAPGTYKDFRRPVFHNRNDGLAYLKETQAFWEGYEGKIADSKIHNPYAQPNQSEIIWGLAMIRIEAKNATREPADRVEDSGPEM